MPSPVGGDFALEALSVRFALGGGSVPDEQFFCWVEVSDDVFYLRDVLCAEDPPDAAVELVHVRGESVRRGVHMVTVAVDVSFAICGLIVIRK